MSKRLMIGILLSVAITGCVTTDPDDKASQVQVHEELTSYLDKCQKLGPVTASLPHPHFNIERALVRQLREETLKLGGDSVAIVDSDNTFAKEALQGVAFKCF